jgi:hypothetical protein
VVLGVRPRRPAGPGPRDEHAAGLPVPTDDGAGTVPRLAGEFGDYLYLAFTNATAFSPTDTLPTSRWSKMTMMLQSAIALLIAALIIARVVNVLK